MQEIENIRVVVRLRPFSQEELENDVEDFVEVDGQVLNVKPPAETEVNLSLLPSTPKSSKTGPPKTPKTPKRNPNSFQNKENEQNANIQSMESAPRTPTAPSTPHSVKKEIPRRFAFDKIYLPTSLQKEIFTDVEPYVQAAVEGYNSTIFCYGQTGAGKTHTMMGSERDVGIIPRAVRKIFESIDSMPDSLFVVQIMYVELHMDKFADLLDPQNAPEKKGKKLPSKETQKIEIHEDTKTKTIFLTGPDSLRTTVTSSQQALELIKRGNHARTTASTNLNLNSSRSHSILSIFIESRDNSTKNAPVHVGKLHLVDLAGSERIFRSGVEGIHQKEAVNINSSLTSLGDVLSALSSKNYNGPIPYRNSKLTRLLQDSLGGNSKTFFIVNIQTSAPNYQETLMSLMYGQRAKKIKNIISLNKDVQGTSDLQQLYNEIDDLKKRLTDRTKEFEMIKAVGVNTLEQNKLLKEKLDVLNRVNEEEINNLEAQLEDVVHHQKTEIYQVKLECMKLQSNLEAEKKEQLELKLKLIREKDEREDLQSALNNTKEELAKAKKELSSSNEAKAELEAKVKQLTEKQKELTAQLASVLAANTNASNQHTKYQEQEKELKAVTKKLEEQISSKTELEEEYKQIKRKAESLSKEISSLKSSTSKHSSDSGKISELEESLHSCQKELQEKTKEIKKITKQRDELQAKLEAAESVKSLSPELREARQQNLALEAKIKSMQERATEVQRSLNKESEDVPPVQDAPVRKSKGSKRKETQDEREEEVKEKTKRKKRKSSPEVEKADKVEKKKRDSKKAKGDDDMEVEELPATKLIEKPVEPPKPTQQKRKLFNVEDPPRNPLSPVENRISSQPKPVSKPKTLHSLFQFGGFVIPKLKKGHEASNKENE